MQLYKQTGHLDHNGYPIYETVDPTPVPPTKRYKSVFSKFFVIQEGVISISLRDITVSLGLTLTACLLWWLYATCTDGTFQCNLHEFPMVSNVIGLKMYDRWFLFLSSVLMFGANIANVRAFYKKLYGVVSNGKNDTLMVLGIVSSFSLPMIGVFDMYNWGKIHDVIAVSFFGCFGFYCNILANYLYENKNKYSAADQAPIATMKKSARTLMIMLVLLGLSAVLHGPTPLFEWVLVIYYVNFFAIASYANAFYDSIHEEGTLVYPSAK